MQTLYNSLTTAALTVLLFVGTPVGPALANVPVDAQISQALAGNPPELQLPISTPQTQPAGDRVQLGSLFGDDGIPSVPEMTLERYRAMDAGSTSTCAIRQKDGRIVCWGLNDFGQANALQGVYSSLSMGQYHGCAIKKNGALTCWGLPAAMPQGKQGTGRYRVVSSGDDHTCAIRNNKTLECWGDNSNGELDAPPGKYRDMSARGNHTCAVTTDKQLRCWGETDFVTYTPVSGRFTEVSTGQLHACTLRMEDGKPLCWGNNSDGQTQPPVNESFIHLVSGDYHTCGLRPDHSTVCWGRNQFGQANLDLDDVRQIAAGGAQSCLLTRKGGHLHCVGSFAHNPILAGKQYQQAVVPDGMAAPKFAWAVFMPGLTSVFDNATSNVMGLLFDKNLNNWQKGGKSASIMFSVLGLIFGQVLPGNNDPLPPIYKEMLEDIQTRVKDLQVSMNTVNSKVGQTLKAVNELKCSDTTQTVRDAAAYVKSELGGTAPYGPFYYMSQAMKQYSLVMTDMNMANRELARQHLEKFYQLVVDFKMTYMVGVNNLGKVSDAVTTSLLGDEDKRASPLDACKAVSRIEWLESKPNKPYPFDDRPIWKGGYEVLLSARTTQAAIANLLSQNAGFELLAAFSGPKFRIDGTTEPDTAPAIDDYNPTAIDNSQGICQKAEEESGKTGANPRWSRVKNLCKAIGEDAHKRYREHVLITEFFGGAYSDRDMVLSLTAKQMGDAQPSETKTNEENWLWLRKPNVYDFLEYPSAQNMIYGPRKDRSPFIHMFTFKDNLKSDAEIYMSNVDKEGKPSFGEGVWHSNKAAWDDLFLAREKIRKEWKLDDTYEDVVERMADEPSTIEPACELNPEGNCKIVRKQNKQGDWVDEIVPAPPPKLFENVKGIPFWLIRKSTSDKYDNILDYSVHCMGYKAWARNCNDKDMGHGGGNGFGGYSFIASGINKAHMVDGKPTGNHWYHPNPSDERKRGYLKLSGRVSTGEEWGATMINQEGYAGDYDCNFESECVGLGFSIFLRGSGFKPYQKEPWFYNGGDIRNPPRKLSRWGASWKTLYRYFDSDFNSRSRFTHMPVVRISERGCHKNMVASNWSSVINSGVTPQFIDRKGDRDVAGVKVPSICGRDLDLTIQQGMTRPANVDMPDIRVIE